MSRPPLTPATPLPAGPRPWLVLGLGALLGPVLATLPLLQYVGWFLASLVHETGHCVAAWLFGLPAYPAIRLDGHAAAMHSEQRLTLVTFVWALIGWIAWRLRHRPRARAIAAAAFGLYPVLAFTEARDLIHLLAGHGGELVFAGVFFYRALSGGFTESIPERITYGACAWFLLGRNIAMDYGIMTSEAARAAYIGNGSFGLTQDFVRAAALLDWSLAGVGALMLVLSLATLPLAWWIWRCVECNPAWRAVPRNRGNQNGGYAGGNRIDSQDFSSRAKCSQPSASSNSRRAS
ncbi:MAG: hypothetical protein O2894_02830 [Planctomycetota bacterium]|nr:hypothetical protein [Planctomycetota bacterium]